MKGTGRSVRVRVNAVMTATAEVTRAGVAATPIHTVVPASSTRVAKGIGPPELYADRGPTAHPSGSAPDEHAVDAHATSRTGTRRSAVASTSSNPLRCMVQRISRGCSACGKHDGPGPGPIDSAVSKVFPP